MSTPTEHQRDFAEHIHEQQLAVAAYPDTPSHAFTGIMDEEAKEQAIADDRALTTSLRAAFIKGYRNGCEYNGPLTKLFQ